MRSGNPALVIGIATAAALSGCASTYSVTPGVEARVFFTPYCPISGEAGRAEAALAGIGVALLSNLAGSIVGSGIDALAQSLTAEKVATVGATNRYSDFFQASDNKQIAIKSDRRCVVALVGRFSAESAENESVTEAIKKKGMDFWGRLIGIEKGLPQVVNNMATILSRSEDASRAFKAVSDIHFYAEYAINYTNDSAYAATDPRHVFIGKFIGESSLVDHKRKDIKYMAEISKPGTGPFIKIEFEQPSVEKSDRDFLLRLTGGELGSHKGLWQPLGSVNAVPANFAGKSFLPVNVKMSYTETQKPGEFSKLVGGALSQQKKDVVTLVENETKYALSSSERQKVRLAALSDADKAFTAYQTEYLAASGIQAKYSAATDETDKSKLMNEYMVRRRLAAMKEEIVRSAFAEADLPFTPFPALTDLK